MSQHASNVNVVLTVDQIKQRMPLLRGKIPSGQKNVHTHFPEGKREVGEGEGLKNWADGTIYSELSSSLALTEIQQILQHMLSPK